MVLPAALRKPVTKSLCSAVTLCELETADMPSPNRIGEFGITRIIGFVFPITSSINEMLFPAAKVTISASGLICSFTSDKTSPKSCGFTTKSNTWAVETLLTTSFELIEYVLVNSSTRSERFSEIVIDFGFMPYFKRAEISASPIIPAPMSPTFGFVSM